MIKSQKVRLKIGKWAVGNSKEAIARFSEAGGIQSDEILVSFDVKVLFPSVPMKKILYLFKGWIMTHENSSELKKKKKTVEETGLHMNK